MSAPTSSDGAKEQKQLPVRRRRAADWANLVLPWLLIVIVACVASAVAVRCIYDIFRDSALPFSRRRTLELEDPSTAMYRQYDMPPIFQHPTLFPLSASDYYGLFFAVVGLMFAAGGGIGGGGLLVPIYILVMGFSPKHAIPLSNVTVFGGAVANVILNARKRHPMADRPLVDWDLILVMEPLTIASALIGAFLNKMLPELILTVLLVLLLSSTAWGTLRKAVKMYKQETIVMERTGIENGLKGNVLMRILAEENDDHDEAANKLLNNMEDQDYGTCKLEETDIAAAAAVAAAAAASPELQKHQQDQQDRKEAALNVELDQILEDERVTPRINLNILLTLFAVVIIINLLKGDGAYNSPLGIVCGSTGFWLANALMILWILTMSMFARQYLLQKYAAKKRCHYQYLEGDIQWDERATLIYPSLCMLAGLFAGMFGVGGGIVKGPLMLAMGVHPAVSSASSACMILFTSFTATTSYVVFGLLLPDYAAVCLVVGFLDVWGASVLVVLDGTSPAQLVYCIFDWWRRPSFGLLDDDSVPPQYDIG